MKTISRIASTRGDRGFTLVEVLVAAMILLVALMTLASMFPVGYKQIADAGRMTVGVMGARQILEGIYDVPFNNIANLNGVDTISNTGVIAGLSGTEAAMARRWRYMLAGPTGGGDAIRRAATTMMNTAMPSRTSALIVAARISARA